MSYETPIDDSNPQASRIDGHWAQVSRHLEAKEGKDASWRLKSLYDEDRRLYNAVYWRVDRWIIAQFAKAPMDKSEIERKYTRTEVGLARLATFIHKDMAEGRLMKRWWAPQDLPKLLAKMPK